MPNKSKQMEITPLVRQNPDDGRLDVEVEGLLHLVMTTSKS
jgi:hypothetical protein